MISVRLLRSENRLTFVNVLTPVRNVNCTWASLDLGDEAMQVVDLDAVRRVSDSSLNAPKAPAPAGPLSVVRTPTMLHDENYKRLFASKLMVEHLLRACLPDDLLAAADFSELGELSTEYVSDELRKRHGDTVWRLRLGERWVYLLILLEFQSEDDPWMALRILTYPACSTRSWCATRRRR